jgi:sporulation protein YlmC with PRC-barrel domain
MMLTSLMMGLFVAGWAAPATSAEKAPAEKSATAKEKILVARSFRVSKLEGLNVRNMQGEKLGTVNDLVVDIPTGKVAYAAVSVGGVLGVGDKLFAVPYNELKFDHGNDEMFFVLDMAKQKLEAAPGFDQANWPDFADPQWTAKIDKYYHDARTTTTSERRDEK